VGDRERVRGRVDEGLAYLRSVQRAEGFFPFPDLRGTASPFASLLESHYRQYPEDFVDGWIVEDHGDGGLQFDNGVCAVAMLAAYAQRGEDRYLDSARRACAWTLTRPVVLNWNYNAFSVWALARYTRVSGDHRFVDAAVERLELGVLPGQLPSGRWMDRHNARTVYHAIILRAMAELYGALPEAHPVRPRLREAIERAERSLVDEVLAHGATDADHSLSALSAVERSLGADARRARAIRVIGNAMYAHLVEPGGTFLDDLTLLAVGGLLARSR
jgi:hypothetical protein